MSDARERDSNPAAYCAICRSPRSDHEPRALGCPVLTRPDGSVLYGPTRFNEQEKKP